MLFEPEPLKTILVSTASGHERDWYSDDILFDMNGWSDKQKYDLFLRCCPVDILESFGNDFPETREAVNEIAEDMGCYCEYGVMEQKAISAMLEELGKKLAQRYTDFVVEKNMPVSVKIGSQSGNVCMLPKDRRYHQLVYPQAVFHSSFSGELDIKDGWYAMLEEPSENQVYVFELTLPEISFSYKEEDGTVSSAKQELLPSVLNQPILIACPEALEQYSSFFEPEYQFRKSEARAVSEIRTCAVYVTNSEIAGYLPVRICGNFSVSEIRGFRVRGE